MPVAEYMALCLFDPAHGYYTTHDPLGARGDFITAPEVSQMFGELIGLWVGAVWKQMGAPENVRLIELGPGRGTMMKDALRAVKIVPEFKTAIVAHLVEISPRLRAQQERTLEDAGVPVFLARGPRRGPERTSHYFRQRILRRAAGQPGDQDRARVGTSGGSRSIPPASLPLPLDPSRYRFFKRSCHRRCRPARTGAIFEWRADTVAIELGRRIADGRGAALVIDYGHTETGLGETLQAVGQHAYADPLTMPGRLDLTAHVDFQALTRGNRGNGRDRFWADRAIALSQAAWHRTTRRIA